MLEEELFVKKNHHHTWNDYNWGSSRRPMKLIFTMQLYLILTRPNIEDDHTTIETKYDLNCFERIMQPKTFQIKTMVVAPLRVT